MYNKKLFIVQEWIDGELCVSLKTANEVIKFIDMLDCYPSDHDYCIFGCGEFGRMKPVYYTGWQSNCLIELEDDDGNIVISGYGTDH